MQSQLRLLLSKVRSQDGFERIVVLALSQGLENADIIPEQIVGKLLDPVEDANGAPKLEPENFARNGAFVDFLHNVIENQGPLEAGLIAEAREKGDGFVYLVDERADVAHMLDEDIFGRFRVSDGVIVPSSYERNLEHRIFSQKGFFQLPSGVHARLGYELALLIKRNEENIRPNSFVN